MRTTLCCEVQPAVVAVGSIFLAACDLNIPLAKETGWYELFDVTWEDVVKVCTRILALYKREPPKYIKLAETRPVAPPKIEKGNTKAAKKEKSEDPAPSGATSAEGGATAPEEPQRELVNQKESEKVEDEPQAVNVEIGNSQKQGLRSEAPPPPEPASPMEGNFFRQWIISKTVTRDVCSQCLSLLLWALVTSYG